jgi:hypothetical protein
MVVQAKWFHWAVTRARDQPVWARQAATISHRYNNGVTRVRHSPVSSATTEFPHARMAT